MTATLRVFLASDDGAVSVDWVVLTAAVVGMALAVVTLVSPGFENLGVDMRNEMANTRPLTEPFNGNQDVTAAGDIALE
jgi:Flp pilus assembly pilin Flp